MRPAITRGFPVGALAAACLCCSQRPETSARMETQRQEALLRMKAQCKEAGEKAHEKFISLNPSGPLTEPEYGYSETLNTCLYEDSYVDRPNAAALKGSKGSTRTDRFVFDVYANRVILEYIAYDGRSITESPDPVMCRTEKEYEARKAALFGAPEPTASPQASR